jgi:hypothetical protein
MVETIEPITCPPCAADSALPCAAVDDQVEGIEKIGSQRERDEQHRRHGQATVSQRVEPRLKQSVQIGHAVAPQFAQGLQGG